MSDRSQTLMNGAVIALIAGWIAYVGRDILVPIALGVLVAYVIVGAARMMARVPVLGRAPLQTRYVLAIGAMAVASTGLALLLIASKSEVMSLAPRLQASLLSGFQQGAAVLGIETEPTWETLRQEVLVRINIQQWITAGFASAAGILTGLIVVGLFSVFLLTELRFVDAKIAHMWSNADDVAKARAVVADINARVGSYLALKALLGVLLAAASYLIMVIAGLQLAAFWSVLIALLNFVPYAGSLLSVLLPAMMSLVQFGTLQDLIAVAVPLTIVQFLNGNILDPYVMGNSLNLSPFVILASLAIWSALWGIAGAFLAIPITVILKIVLAEFGGTRWIAVLLSRTGTP